MKICLQNGAREAMPIIIVRQVELHADPSFYDGGKFLIRESMLLRLDFPKSINDLLGKIL